LTIFGSTAFAIYWTVHAHALGDAFTAAGFFVAVIGFIVTVVLNRHSSHCKCWKKIHHVENGQNMELARMSPQISRERL
jgi:hypothetical protein